MTKTAETPATVPSVPDDIAHAGGLVGSVARAKPYTVATDAARVSFADGDIFRAAHVSQLDADGRPLALLVYEPRGQRAQLIALPIVGAAIASGLISPAEIAALTA
jgi:hypothetical protein